VLLLTPSFFPLPNFHSCLVLTAHVLLMSALALVLEFAAPLGFYCCWVPPPTQIPPIFLRDEGAG